MKKYIWVGIFVVIGIFAGGCALNAGVQASSTPTVAEPMRYGTVPQTFEQNGFDVNISSQFGRRRAESLRVSACQHPAGWRRAIVGEEESAGAVAARYAVSLEELLGGNCIADPLAVVPGLSLYVPFNQPAVLPQTSLPLGISSFAAEASVVQPGQRLHLSWQAQGPVHAVRIGWLFNGQFYEQAGNLPAAGIAELTVPDDGRDAVRFMALASDGANEVAALTVVQVLCRESWFFAPSPVGCPSAPLVTSFHEQRFERGTIVHIPSLGIHYVMAAGQEAVMVGDGFVPGMPQRDTSIVVPAGFAQTQGPIHYIWRNEGVRSSLGYAVGEEVKYPGLLQRTVSEAGELVYFSASSGHVYRTGEGLVWGVIIPG
jgi:hypothetical protein